MTYRNIKSFLPFVIETKYDRELHLLDHALLFGHDPATVLHTVLGTGIAAYVLSFVYLWFLPMVPLVVTAWVVWARNLSYGYWFVTSQCLAWVLGTISYYALPTLGPGFRYVQLYTDLPNTPSERLMDSLDFTRDYVVTGTLSNAVQSVAGFASLHCGITMLVALMVTYTINIRWLRDRGLGQLRHHRGRHPLLRLALHRRRRRRHPDRPGQLLHRRSRQRPEVRRWGAALAPDDHHLGGPGPARLTRIRELHRCSTSRRHADESEKSARFGLTGAQIALRLVFVRRK